MDIPERLETLAIPTRLHNSSAKLTFDEFVDEPSGYLMGRVLALTRNVFHELDIERTADLLCALNTQLPPEATVYIQDVEQLPRAERGNAGWDRECFAELLHSFGMSCEAYDLRSRSGTPWFALRARPSGQRSRRTAAIARCASARREQRRRISERLEVLNNDISEDTSAEIMVLSLEAANIDLQLGRVNVSAAVPIVVSVAGTPVRMSRSDTAQIFTVDGDSEVLGAKMGLAGVVRSKDAIDIAAFVASARERVWFCGYSNHLTFELPENHDAMVTALGRGAEVRVLSCEPGSDAVIARAQEVVYETPDDLPSAIRSALGAARIFWGVVHPGLRHRLHMRLTASIPPCSYFVVDHVCVASFYTPRLSGDAAPALLFAPAQAPNVGFYEVLTGAFEDMFTRAMPVAFDGLHDA